MMRGGVRMLWGNCEFGRECKEETRKSSRVTIKVFPHTRISVYLTRRRGSLSYVLTLIKMFNRDGISWTQFLLDKQLSSLLKPYSNIRVISMLVSNLQSNSKNI